MIFGDHYDIICFFIVVHMSYKTGEIEYAWMIGTILLGIGAGGKYKKIR